MLESSYSADLAICNCFDRLFRWITHEYNQPGERNTGMDLSLDFLADFIKTEGPFEAVWGFSQGRLLRLVH